MSINLTRLDFTSTINAMLCVAARHAVSADGARQRHPLSLGTREPGNLYVRIWGKAHGKLY